MGFINIYSRYVQPIVIGGSCSQYWIMNMNDSTFWGNIAVDSNDNIYTLRGSPSMLVMKTSPNGEVLWQKVLTGSAGGKGIAIDSSDNIYLLGDGAMLAPSFLSSSFIITKMDTDGNSIWQRVYGSSTGSSAAGIAVDAAGNIYVAGSMYITSPTPANYNAILTKFDSNGNFVWERVFGGSGSSYYHEWLYDVAVDSNDNIFVVGQTGTAIPGRGLNQDVYVVKYDSDGTQLWQRAFGGFGTTIGDESGLGVDIDSTGNLYVAGYANTSGQTPGGNGREALLVKFDTNGSVLWQRTVGATSFDQAYGVAVDVDGNPYFVGGIASKIAIAKFDANGNVQWLRSVGKASSLSGQSIAIDSQGDLCIGGSSSIIVKIPRNGTETGTYGDFTYAATDGDWTVTNTNMTLTTVAFPNKTTTTSNNELTLAVDDSTLTPELTMIKECP